MDINEDVGVRHVRKFWTFQHLAMLGFLLMLIVLIVGGISGYRNVQELAQSEERVRHTHAVLIELERLSSIVKDAETGQDELLLVDIDEFQPYMDALKQVEATLERLKQLMADNPERLKRLDTLEAKLKLRLDELAQTIELTKAGNQPAALAIVRTATGNELMAVMRDTVTDLRDAEEKLLAERAELTEKRYQALLWSIAVTTILGVLLLMTVFLLDRRMLAERHRAAQISAEQREKLRIALDEARAERRLLNAVLEAMPVGVILADPNGKLVRMNRANTEIWGPPPVSKSIDEYGEWIGYWPESGERIKAHEWAMARALTTGEEVPGELVEIERFDGTGRRMIINTAAPIQDSAGRIVAGVIAQVDVTERIRAEQALRESEARFRQIADTMPQIVWVTREDGHHEYFNRRWYEYIGCTPEECLGHGWNTPIHPDDRQRAIDRWKHSLCTGEGYEIEYRFRSKEGEYRWFLGRALPVRDERGRINRWFGTCTDIEDYKRLQAERHRFVSLVENSTDFIAMFDPDGFPFYVNQAGLNMLGLCDLELACRTPVEEFFFPEDRSRIQEEFLPEVIKEGSGETEVRFCHFKTGAPLWMTYSVFSLTDPEGRPVGLATVSRDISQRRQLEDNLRQLAADLSEADRRKDEFLATLAHELRNPLAPIRNGLQILKKVGPVGQVVEHARSMMDRQLAQMVRLVDDLLDVSRITRNKLELRREQSELSTILASAIESSRPLIEQMGHTLRVDLPPEPIVLYADTTRLAQVLMNLLNNAAKYSERGGTIQLTAQLHGESVEIMVKDTGIGIDPDHLPRIFDMFSQVDGSLERAQGGLGIGLTLVRRLVEMHRGEVEARSEGRGKGSEFIVRLPIASSKIHDEPPPNVSDEIPHSSFRVLIVDDNQDGADSLAMIISMTGCEVRTAYDGQEGVDIASEFRPDVVLLDIGLPKLNGYEACQHIREQSWGKDIAMIALTGWGQEEDRRRSQEAGFDHHLVKPVDPDALMKLLTELTSKSA